MGGPILTDSEFERIRKLVYDRFGINLTDQKRALVIGRLQKLLADGAFETYSDYLRHVETDATGEALSSLVDRISTNHTFFFREKAHFDYFVETALPFAMDYSRRKGENDLRIWCAGCATGEEPYTLVILMMETLGMDYKNWNAGLLATDISEQALAGSMKGIYSSDRVSEVPPKLLQKYFRAQGEGKFQMNERVKNEITFRRFNLMNETFPFKKPFHIIFCRNVMIYFNEETRTRLVRKFYDALVPGGYLFIGHSETINRQLVPFQGMIPAAYRKKERE